MTTETENKSSYLISKHLKQVQLLEDIQELERERIELLKGVNDPFNGPKCAIKLSYLKTQLCRIWEDYDKI